MAGIQLQIQNLIKLADMTNTQLADITTVLLQFGETYKMQIGKDIYSISEELQNIMHRDIE